MRSLCVITFVITRITALADRLGKEGVSIASGGRKEEEEGHTFDILLHVIFAISKTKHLAAMSNPKLQYEYRENN